LKFSPVGDANSDGADREQHEAPVSSG